MNPCDNFDIGRYQNSQSRYAARRNFELGPVPNLSRANLTNKPAPFRFLDQGIAYQGRPTATRRARFEAVNIAGRLFK